MRKSIVLILLLPGLVLSCKTEPKPLEAPPAVEQGVFSAPEAKNQADASEGTYAETPEEDGFDPTSISKEVFLAAKTDITAFISDMNRIIRVRNYNAWRTHLADSYIAEVDSKVFLEEKTEELFRRDQIVAQNLGKDPNLVEKRILRTAYDYFNLVVVPSRANDRLDDISFLSETRVRAYTIDERKGGQRLVLYDLAHIGSTWKIVN
jgi:hypothetical protein